jgi:hypothetical protein
MMLRADNLDFDALLQPQTWLSLNPALHVVSPESAQAALSQ